MAGGTKLTAKMSRTAQDLGADGVMILTPYVYTVTDQGIMTHFETIADAIDVGIMIYNNPYNGNFFAGPDLMRHLAEIPQLVASKDISPTIEDFYFGWKAVSDKIAVMDGWGEAHFSFTAAQGCKSFFTNVGNYIPEFAAALYRAAAAEDFVEMRNVMRRYNPVLDMYQDLDATTGGLYLAIVKAGMDYRGLRGGRMRAPLIDLSHEQRRRVESVLSEVGVESAAVAV
jgi:dihydrodipicolinate synthase/N-acetylneuraminate lyase